MPLSVVSNPSSCSFRVYRFSAPSSRKQAAIKTNLLQLRKHNTLEPKHITAGRLSLLMLRLLVWSALRLLDLKKPLFSSPLAGADDETAKPHRNQLRRWRLISIWLPIRALTVPLVRSLWCNWSRLKKKNLPSSGICAQKSGTKTSRRAIPIFPVSFARFDEKHKHWRLSQGKCFLKCMTHQGFPPSTNFLPAPKITITRTGSNRYSGQSVFPLTKINLHSEKSISLQRNPNKFPDFSQRWSEAAAFFLHVRHCFAFFWPLCVVPFWTPRDSPSAPLAKKVRWKQVTSDSSDRPRVAKGAKIW